MKEDEILVCRCGREVKVVRLGSRLALGHTTNPANQSHPVTLARSGDGRSNALAATSEDIRRLSEARDAPLTEPRERRGVVGNGSGRSHGAPSGRSSSAGRASQPGVAPRPRLRPARSAGALHIAGEGE